MRRQPGLSPSVQALRLRIPHPGPRTRTMTKKVYKDLLAALDQAALPVKESEFDRRNSGSWQVLCSSSPALAFQWDGRANELEVFTASSKYLDAGLEEGKSVLLHERGKCPPAPTILAKLLAMSLRGNKGLKKG